MAKAKVNSLFTPSNLHHRTAMLNTDADTPNCCKNIYICGLFRRIVSDKYV